MGVREREKKYEILLFDEIFFLRIFEKKGNVSSPLIFLLFLYIVK